MKKIVAVIILAVAMAYGTAFAATEIIPFTLSQTHIIGISTSNGVEFYNTSRGEWRKDEFTGEIIYYMNKVEKVSTEPTVYVSTSRNNKDIWEGCNFALTHGSDQVMPIGRDFKQLEGNEGSIFQWLEQSSANNNGRKVFFVSSSFLGGKNPYLSIPLVVSGYSISFLSSSFGKEYYVEAMALVIFPKH